MPVDGVAFFTSCFVLLSFFEHAVADLAHVRLEAFVFEEKTLALFDLVHVEFHLGDLCRDDELALFVETSRVKEPIECDVRRRELFPLEVKDDVFSFLVE